MGWTLVSLMSPHVEFGYSAATWPVATGMAVATLLGLLFTKDRTNPFAGLAPKFLLAFTIWICITLPFSLIFEPSLPLWERSMKIYLMVFVTLALIDDRHKLHGLHLDQRHLHRLLRRQGGRVHRCSPVATTASGDPVASSKATTRSRWRSSPSCR